jgi:hypothetical protein
MKRLFLFLLITVLAMAQSLAPGQKYTWTTLSTTGSTATLATGSNDKHTVSAVVTGSPSGCSIQLEGSLDATNWANLSGAQDCTASNPYVFHVAERVIIYVRVNLTTLSGGTAPTVTASYAGLSSGGRR